MNADDDETVDGIDSASRNPLEVLADEFSSAIRSGATPSVEDFASRVPDQREAAIALLRSIEHMERLSHHEHVRHRIETKTQRLARQQLDQVGDYRVIREIGRGGMGIIYEAEQISLKRRVALKVLGPGVADTPRQIERFRRESEAVARLHHTHIVPVFGVGEEDGVHYFAMQLIHGKPLSHPPELTAHELARLGMQAASALAYAHAHGVLHRDIKPSNLLLDNEQNVWITDFGLAKLTDVGELTQTGDIMGTLKYMAPEQLEGKADERTDIYALGLTLYELATGKPAFDVSKSLINRIRNHEFPPPRSVRADVPRDLETIILKATAQDPAARYANATALADDLRRFLEDRPIEARRTTHAERFARWVRRNPALAGSLAATLLLLVTTTVVSLLGYATTSVALKDTQQARDAADLARKAAETSKSRAESNLSVAMQAFDAIFDNVATRGVPQSIPVEIEGEDDAQDVVAPFESTLTEDDAKLLSNLLSFYREFAKQNEEDISLQARTGTAYRRSGMIQQRLGRSDEAVTSYDEAVKIFMTLRKDDPNNSEYVLFIAQILNDRGLAMSSTSKFVPEIVANHHQAISLLNDQPEHVRRLPEVRFEIARAYDLAGSLMTRGGATLAGIDSNPGMDPSRNGGNGPRRPGGPMGPNGNPMGPNGQPGEPRMEGEPSGFRERMNTGGPARFDGGGRRDNQERRWDLNDLLAGLPFGSRPGMMPDGNRPPPPPNEPRHDEWRQDERGPRTHGPDPRGNGSLQERRPPPDFADGRPDRTASVPANLPEGSVVRPDGSIDSSSPGEGHPDPDDRFPRPEGPGSKEGPGMREGPGRRGWANDEEFPRGGEGPIGELVQRLRMRGGQGGRGGPGMNGGPNGPGGPGGPNGPGGPGGSGGRGPNDGPGERFEPPRALQLLIDSELREAIELLEELCKEFPDNDKYGLALAQAYQHRMLHSLISRRSDVAESSFVSAKDKLGELIERRPENPQMRVELADTLAYSSSRILPLSDTDRQAYVEQSISTAEQLCAKFPNVSEYQALLAGIYLKLGIVERQRGIMGDEQNHFRLATTKFRALHQRYPSNRSYQMRYLIAANEYAQAIDRTRNSPDSQESDLIEARDFLQEAIRPYVANREFEPFSRRSLMDGFDCLIRIERKLGNAEGISAIETQRDMLRVEPPRRPF